MPPTTQNPLRTLTLWLTLISAVALTAASVWQSPDDPRTAVGWTGLLLIFTLVIAGRLAKWLVLGLAVAIFVDFHPLWSSAEQTQTVVGFKHTLLWVVLTLNLLVWHLNNADRVRWGDSFGIFVALVLFMYQAWRFDPLMGVLSGSATLVSLLAAGHIGFRYARPPAVRFNGILAGLTALLAPALAAAMVWWIHGRPTGVMPLPESLGINFAAVQRVWTRDLTAAFFGAPWWLVVPLVLAGWYRTLRRGWLDFRCGRMPAVWAVSIFAVGGFVSSFLQPSAGVQPMVPWCAFLIAYLVLDLLQGLAERLVLKPQG